MSRVLITGGAGTLGAAVARLLLADPAYDVRVSDRRPAPQWMREGCEMHRGDLRVAAQAVAATKGCSHVIHLACFAPAWEDPATGARPAEETEPGSVNGAAPGGNGAAPERARSAGGPHSVLEHESLLNAAIVRAAADREIERLVFVSSPLVFERAQQFPTREEHLQECLPPRSARGFARLAGERLCAAAAQERGLRYAICRPFGAYGPLDAEEAAADAPQTPDPAREVSELIDRALAGELPLPISGTGEQTLTPTHVDDLAAGIVVALGAPAAANEDFNLSAERELSLNELAGLAWQAGAGASQELAIEHLPPREEDLARSSPSSAKARELLGWQAQIGLEQGIATIAASRHGPAASMAAPAGPGR